MVKKITVLLLALSAITLSISVSAQTKNAQGMDESIAKPAKASTLAGVTPVSDTYVIPWPGDGDLCIGEVYIWRCNKKTPMARTFPVGNAVKTTVTDQLTVARMKALNIDSCINGTTVNESCITRSPKFKN